MELKTLIKIFILMTLIFSYSNNSFAQEENQRLRDNLIHNLDHFELKNFPDSVSIEIIKNSFSYICKGDKEIFSRIFKLSKKSDAALSELLGTYFGELLISDTNLFLELAVEYSKTDQEDLATLAFLMDGSGMDKESYAKVENSLKQCSKNQNLKTISNQYILFLNKIKQEVNRFN